jgi:hypothetical protein
VLAQAAAQTKVQCQGQGQGREEEEVGAWIERREWSGWIREGVGWEERGERRFGWGSGNSGLILHANGWAGFSLDFLYYRVLRQHPTLPIEC